MHKTIYSIWFAAALMGIAKIGAVHAGPLEVLSNGGGDTSPYSDESIYWYERHLPTLPADYLETNDFVHFEPWVHYIDSVNWSLFSLQQFQSITKDRWVRVPAGKKIRRDPRRGIWHWPEGAETAKLFRAKVRSAGGVESWFDLELRLARKISTANAPRMQWAMGLYVRDTKSREWRVVRSPALKIHVERALTPVGGVRNVAYTLTPPEACMTCHSQSSMSRVDLKRGDEYVYGANEELLSGRTKIRLSQWIASDEIRSITQELSRSASDDWIEIQLKDEAQIRKNRETFAPLIE